MKHFLLMSIKNINVDAYYFSKNSNKIYTLQADTNKELLEKISKKVKVLSPVAFLPTIAFGSIHIQFELAIGLLVLCSGMILGEMIYNLTNRNLQNLPFKDIGITVNDCKDFFANDEGQNLLIEARKSMKWLIIIHVILLGVMLTFMFTPLRNYLGYYAMIGAYGAFIKITIKNLKVKNRVIKDNFIKNKGEQK